MASRLIDRVSANDARSPLYVATPACTTCMLRCLPSIIDGTGSRLRHPLPSLHFLFCPFFSLSITYVVTHSSVPRLGWAPLPSE